MLIVNKKLIKAIFFSWFVFFYLVRGFLFDAAVC